MPAHRQDDPSDSQNWQRRTNESFDLTLGSKRLRISGGATLLILLLATALGYVIWMGGHSTTTLTEAIEKLGKEHHEIVDELRNSREEQSYILMLDQAKKDQIRDRLRVPERFR